MATETNGPVAQAITAALSENFQPVHLEVINESYMHNVPKGAETHFKVLVVSEKFDELPLIKVKQSFFMSVLLFIMICIYSGIV